MSDEPTYGEPEDWDRPAGPPHTARYWATEALMRGDDTIARAWAELAIADALNRIIDALEHRPPPLDLTFERVR